MVAVNLFTILTWSVVGVVVLGAIILVAAILGTDVKGAEDLEELVPPEIWGQISPAAKASFRMLGKTEGPTRDKFKRLLERMADGYLQEKRSPLAQQAYMAALLEALGKYTL